MCIYGIVICDIITRFNGPAYSDVALWSVDVICILLISMLVYPTPPPSPSLVEKENFSAIVVIKFHKL